MGNGSTWPENDYRGMNTCTRKKQLNELKQLPSTHARTKLGSIITSKQIYLFNTKKDNTVMIFMLFLPKVKCVITSKQMANTHPNFSKISYCIENTDICVCMLHTKNVECLPNSQPASEAYHAFVMTLCIFEGCQLIKTFKSQSKHSVCS